MENFEVHQNIEDLDSESKYLIHKAKEATHHSYAPYSKFEVGAALLLDDGTVVTGANQENASYPLCMCAERVALYVASSLHPGKKITKLAVVAHKRKHKELLPATSCGACRQVLLEFEHRQQAPIQLLQFAKAGEWVKSRNVASLLPFDFSGENLLEV
jgi:cytidine deaminase